MKVKPLYKKQLHYYSVYSSVLQIQSYPGRLITGRDKDL